MSRPCAQEQVVADTASASERSRLEGLRLLRLLDGLIDGQVWDGSQSKSAHHGERPESRDRNLFSSRLPIKAVSSFERKWLTLLGFTVGGSPDAADLPIHSAVGEERLGQALPFCRAVLEVMMDFDPKISFLLLQKQGVVPFFSKVMSWPPGDFIKNAKFFTVYPMARFLRNPPPASPPPSYGFDGSVGSALLFTGPVRRYLKSRLNSARPQYAPLFLGFLQGVKRGCAVVPETFVREAYAKHAKALSKHQDVESNHYLKSIPKFDAFWKGIRPLSGQLSEPSTSASFHVSRSEGGGRREIQRVNADPLSEPMLYRMVETYPGVIREQKSVYDVRSVAELEETIASRPDHRSVEVHAVCEPLKVRLITKGDSHRMWYSRRLQRAMWDHLQTRPQFRLTGEPLTLDHLRWVRDATKRLNLPFNRWVSGDYQAATDNLKIQYTKLSNEAAMEACGASETSREIFRSVLYEQTLYYPKSALDPRDPDTSAPFCPKDPGLRSGPVPVKQGTGQLMGSVLSFPHLVSANAVAYWIALERYLGKPIGLDELPVLINGDDILFMANDEFYAIWQEEIAKMGFLLSVGKNYIHEHFLCINSESFWYVNGDFTPIRYLNTGLLSGQSKLSGRLETRLAPIWDNYNVVLRGAQNRAQAHQRFLELNRKQIESYTNCGMYNLFVDQRLGGLGFDLYPEVMPLVHFTPFQRKFGHYLLQSTSKLEGQVTDSMAYMGIVAKKDVRGKTVTLPHWGRYEQRPYVNVGTTEAPVWELLIDPDERLATSREIRPPLLSEVRETEKPEFVVVHPRQGVLRQFRQARGHFTSVKPLLAAPRAFVERVVDPEEMGFQMVIAQNGGPPAAHEGDFSPVPDGEV